jgi:DNA-binding transcriptional regulator GbsR (MarR family)
MSEMHTLIEQLTHWYEDVKQLETERLATLLSLGAKVTKFLEAKDRVVSLGRSRRPNPANKS